MAFKNKHRLCRLVVFFLATAGALLSACASKSGDYATKGIVPPALSAHVHWSFAKYHPVGENSAPDGSRPRLEPASKQEHMIASEVVHQALILLNYRNSLQPFVFLNVSRVDNLRLATCVDTENRTSLEMSRLFNETAEAGSLRVVYFTSPLAQFCPGTSKTVLGLCSYMHRAGGVVFLYNRNLANTSALDRGYFLPGEIDTLAHEILHCLGLQGHIEENNVMNAFATHVPTFDDLVKPTTVDWKYKPHLYGALLAEKKSSMARNFNLFGGEFYGAQLRAFFYSVNAIFSYRLAQKLDQAHLVYFHDYTRSSKELPDQARLWQTLLGVTVRKWPRRPARVRSQDGGDYLQWSEGNDTSMRSFKLWSEKAAADAVVSEKLCIASFVCVAPDSELTPKESQFTVNVPSGLVTFNSLAAPILSANFSLRELFLRIADPILKRPLEELERESKQYRTCTFLVSAADRKDTYSLWQFRADTGAAPFGRRLERQSFRPIFEQTSSVDLNRVLAAVLHVELDDMLQRAGEDFLIDGAAQSAKYLAQVSARLYGWTPERMPARLSAYAEHQERSRDANSIMLMAFANKSQLAGFVRELRAFKKNFNLTSVFELPHQLAEVVQKHHEVVYYCAPNNRVYLLRRICLLDGLAMAHHDVCTFLGKVAVGREHQQESGGSCSKSVYCEKTSARRNNSVS